MLKRLCYFAYKILRNPVQGFAKIRWLLGAVGVYGVWQILIGEFNVSGKWFRSHRPGARLLKTMRKRVWPENSPRLSILMCVYNTNEPWLRQALDSVLEQVYPHWELICVDDASPAPHIAGVLAEYAKKDKRIRVVTLPKNSGVSVASNAGLKQATGDYICFMDHDDMLEPQALYRFAEAATLENPDIIYSDEVLTEEDINDIGTVLPRPAFSYDYYLSHPYFVHFIAVRRTLAERIDGFDESFKISQDYDFILRALVHAKTVTHVSDVLYRWRTVKSSLGHERANEVMQLSMRALNRHLEQIGFAGATVKQGKSFNFFDVQYPLPKSARVAIIIPTKDQAALLRQCLESLLKTVPASLADIFVVDHESREPETLALLEEMKSRGIAVLPHKGPFNFSVINNAAVAKLPKPYQHYLFLNNDTEATQHGWLEHMVSLAAREDVGVVGSLLLYADGTVQHAGVVVGLSAKADHSHRFEPFYRAEGDGYSDGLIGSLKCVRDYSAVTAACMLVSANAFHAVGGYDETIAVGFGDTDLCLRIVEAGHRVLFDPYAVLKHYESVSRGKSVAIDAHPEDSREFVRRYAALLKSGDPFYSPLLDPFSNGTQLKRGAGSILKTQYYTQSVRRPEPAKPAKDIADAA